jgi:hypothetical protein
MMLGVMVFSMADDGYTRFRVTLLLKFGLPLAVCFSHTTTPTSRTASRIEP